jgi:hypothetical protein
LIFVIKERALLRRVKVLLECSTMEPLQRQTDLIIGEIKELLAQPEHIPDIRNMVVQEPVGIVRTIGGYPDDSEHVVDWLCKYKDLKEGDRLYLAPPKREPLSDGATADMYHANKKATHPDSYWSGVYDAEKAHGIGGGE